MQEFYECAMCTKCVTAPMPGGWVALNAFPGRTVFCCIEHMEMWRKLRRKDAKGVGE